MCVAPALRRPAVLYPSTAQGCARVSTNTVTLPCTQAGILQLAYPLGKLFSEAIATSTATSKATSNTGASFPPTITPYARVCVCVWVCVCVSVHPCRCALSSRALSLSFFFFWGGGGLMQVRVRTCVCVVVAQHTYQDRCITS